MRILVADKFPEPGIEALRELGCEVTCDPDLKEAGLGEALEGEAPEILIVRSTKVNLAHLEASPRLALVIRAGAGVNTIDVAAASERGVYVANCPGKNSVAVAELAFAHILAADRRLVDGAQDLREGRWNKKGYSRARGIKGTTLGLLGLGKIGLEMIPRAQAFGMRVVAWSRSLTPERAEELGVDHADSPAAVASEADVLSVHTALTADTRGLVNEGVLAALRPGALLVNTSRDAVVDQAALVRAIEERGLRAALDVFEGEPAGGAGEVDSELFRFPGVQGSHHIGASTEEAQLAVASEAVRIVRGMIQEGRVYNCVNLAERTPATHLLVVRHRDEVGVLAGVLERVRSAGINVQEMENVVFLGARAACARIQLDGEPPRGTLGEIEGAEHVLAVSVTSL